MQKLLLLQLLQYHLLHYLEKFLELNRELSQIWPVITHAKAHPDDADDWRDVKDKLKYLER